MTRRPRHRLHVVVALGLASSLAAAAQDAALPVIRRSFSKPATVIASPETVFQMLQLPDRDPQALQSPTRWRGGLETFQSVAPSVVVVRTDTGHGTGFIVSADGDVVTNYHVIASGLRHDSAKGGSYAMVHLGRMGPDGTMSLLPEPVRAYVIRTDATRDLSVLRIAGPVPGLGSIPRLVLSDSPPRPGQDCAIVGHPSSGMLWTMRPGQVAGVGQLPGDLVNVVMLKLASSGEDRERVAAQLRALPSRRIILTSAGANPGDSGGPVVDERGRVIAVTFGGPGKAEESKFTYHVHLEELKTVLANLPAEPMYVRPDAWALGPRVELQDVDGDDRPDVLLAGGEKQPDTLLLDIDNDTPPASTQDLAQLIAGKKWDFEVGVSTQGSPTAFYDTDNDGVIDLIVTGRVVNGMVDGRFVRSAAGKWTYESGLSLPLLRGQYLKTPVLAARAERLMRTVFAAR